jgi:hypothetical protein
MIDAGKMIGIFQALLAQLEQTVSVLPQLVEDGRTDNLSNQIQSYQTRLARVKNVLRKHQEHDRRQKQIQQQNRANARRR